MSLNDYTLHNVRIEEGFEYHQQQVIHTVTGLYTLTIRAGKLAEITPQGTTWSALPEDYTHIHIDAQGHLLLPALSDMHIHLDKTFYTEPWQAPRRGKNIMEMIAIDADWVKKLLPKSQYRAEQLIRLLLRQGTHFARSHCNIDPVSGIQGLVHLQQALANYQDIFQAEIVSFPQHGLLLSNSVALMREAAQAGVHFIGGLDPSNVDGQLNKSLDTVFDLANEYQLGLDIHLHESEQSGIDAFNYILDTVERTPRLQQRVTISHGFALANLDGKALGIMAERMAHLGVSLTTTIPLGKSCMPLPTLLEQGVNVMVGTDSVVDHWSPFGTADMLEKANLYAQVYRHTDEFRLSRALKIATRGVTPLNDQGERVWPALGQSFNAILVQASCSAEAVARIAPRVELFSQGIPLSTRVAQG